MRPYYEDFVEVLLAAKSVVAGEGKGFILDKVASEDGFDYQVENDQFFNELQKGLVGIGLAWRG